MATNASDNEYDNSARELSSVAGGRASSADSALVIRPLPCLVLVLLTGLVVWAILDAILPIFHLPEHLSNLAGNSVTADQLQESRAMSASVRNNNAAVAIAVSASALALVLAATEMLFRRDPLRAIWGGLLAGVLAAGVGLAAATFGAMLMSSLSVEDRLTKTLLTQAAVLGVLGLGVGMAVSLPIFRAGLLGNCTMGGLLGGLLAALAFPIAVSFLLPRVNTEGLVAEGAGLLLWILLAYGLIGVTMAGLGKEKRRGATPVASSQAPP